MSTGIACRDLLELLSGYIDGALDPGTTAAIDAHIAGCDGCTSVLDEFRRTIALTGELREEQVPPSQRDLLLSAFRGWAAGTAG
jgi:anti-sigma factor RsiW